MYSTLETGDSRPASPLQRLARRDLPTTPRAPLKRALRDETALTSGTTLWPELSIGSTLLWLRKGALWVGVLTALGVFGGLAYSVVATPKFTTTTDLIVDPGNLQVVKNDLFAPTLDQNAQLLDVESKLRVLTSGNVLARVVETLGLQNDPEFAATGDSPTSPIVAATAALEKKVNAWREERSFVVTLAVSTETADKSVTIANAIVAAFQTELAQANADGASRSAAGLMDRINSLKTDVAAAEDAVEAFKTAHGLQSTAQGDLFNAQSMTLLNGRVVDAQQALIAAQSRYDALTDASTGAANVDAVSTDTMVVLRTQYGTLKQQLDAAATMYGPKHPTRASAERQLAGIKAQIDAEAQRAVQSARLELEQAKSTVASLTSQSEATRTTLAMDGQAQVELRDLERDAKAKSDVYEAYLARAREITEQTQLDTTNIRVISPATPPDVRSWPPRGVILAGAGAAGGAALGVLLALGLGWFGAFRQLMKR